MYKNKEIFIFDVDDTLAESFGPIYPVSAKIICSLLCSGKTVIFATCRSKELIEDRVLAELPCGSKYFNQIYLQPTGGAAMYKWQNNTWVEEYAERMSDSENNKIIRIYKKALKAIDPQLTNNPYALDKDGTMLSIAALQPGSPREERATWDPNQEKRKKIIDLILAEVDVDGLDVNVGGASSINIARSGVDKAYGINKLFKILKLDKSKALFVGDGIYPGGNDYCILQTGIDTVRADSPEDFAEKFKFLIT